MRKRVLARLTNRRLTFSAQASILTADGSLPAVSMQPAYAGGKLHLPNFPLPVVIDLATLRASGAVIPMLR